MKWLSPLVRSGDFYVARAADGEPVAFAGVTVDVRCAFLLAFMAAQHHDQRSWARHLLHVHVVAALAKAGVTHLVRDSAFQLTPGIQYFQHLVGAKPANVKIRRIGR